MSNNDPDILVDKADRYHLAFVRMNEGFCVIQIIFNECGEPVDYIVREVNPAFEKHTGLCPTHVLNKLASTYDPALVWFDRYTEIVRTNQSIRFEEYNQFIGRWLEVNADPVGRDDELTVIFKDITCTKQREDNLSLRLEKFSGLTRIDEGFFLCQLAINEQGEAEDLFILEANDAAESHSGIPKDLLLGRVTKDPPYLDDVWRMRFSEVVRTGNSIRFEEYNESTNRWYDVFAYSLHKDNIYAVLFNDITQQKHAVQALQENMNKYKSLFNIIDEAFCIVEIIYDSQGKAADCLVLETNPMFEKHLGVAEADGRLFKELVPDLEAYWFDVCGKVALTGEPARFLGLSESLNQRWLDVGVFKLGGAESNKVAILFNNVTGTKQSIEQVNHHNVILQGINRVYEQAILCKGMEEFGEACLKIVGSVTESKFGFINELNEQGLLNVIAISDMGGDDDSRTISSRPLQNFPVQGLYGSVIRTGKSLLTNCPESHPDSIGVPKGHPQLTAFLGVPFLWDGKVMGMIGVANREGGYRPEDKDILEALAPTILETILRKRAEEALRHSQEEYRAIAEELRAADSRKNEFLGVLSHELRNPLASIRMGLSVLDRATPGGAEAANAKQIMHRQAIQLTRLIDDLLDITRISRDKISLQRKREDFNVIVNKAVDDYLGQFSEKGVGLAVKLCNEDLYVNADEVRLIQVVGNLLHNALKFTKAGYDVSVTVSKDCLLNEVVLSVEDNGIGIPPEVLPQLFQPFIQVDRTLDRSLGGLGLGLSLIKGLVELHGGTVTSSSDGIGSGAQFTVRLPLLSDIKSAQEDLPSESEHKSLRVLVIDDIQDVAEVLAALLRHLGHQVAVAQDGPTGIDAARDFRPEAVICDIGLPGLDGYEVARLIRDDDFLKNIYLIALTGYARPKDVIHALEAGFDEHLAKPVDIEVLKQALLRITQKQ